MAIFSKKFFLWCRGFSVGGSQSCDASFLSGELGASQSRTKSHLKPRLGWTRQVLTNQSPEESAIEQGQVVGGNAALISPTTSYPVLKSPGSRKISYMEAVQHGHMSMDPLAEEKLSHLPVNAMSMSGQYHPRQMVSSYSRLHHGRLAYHQYSLDDRHGTEIISPVDPVPYRSHSRYQSRENHQGSFL